MRKLALLSGVLTAFCPLARAQQSSPASPAQQTLPVGKVIPKVSSATQAEQSYALYLPSGYTSEKHWPIVYAFDPAARGSMPVELMKSAAERYGYIVAGSNNAQNGPWKPEFEAAQATYHDTHMRLAIDNNRLYLAGFSGGARFAASLARDCKCAAGLFLNGAGFSPSSPPAAGATFSVFAAIGTLDFNYGEAVSLDAKLETLHYAHALRRFDGSHDWAPASVMDEAFAWFRLIAMKEGREARDMTFVKEEAGKAEERGKTLELAGDRYDSWEEYRQAADTFDGLADSSSFREHAAALEKEKAVRQGAKREQKEFEEQARLTAGISTEVAALNQNSPDTPSAQGQVEQQISELRSRAKHEKNPEELRVVERALVGVYIELMEDGEERSKAKDNLDALPYFELASEANPESVSALEEVAAARALNGDRKGAIEALCRAKENSKDTAAFSAWLQEEPAFAKFRDTVEFRALVAPAEDRHKK